MSLFSLKIVFLNSLLLTAISSSSAFAFCDKSDVVKTVTGKFKVLKVQKAKVECSIDEDKNVFKPGTAAQLDGCSVELKDLKTGKRHRSYGGSVGCTYKVGQIVSPKLQYSCCGVEVTVTCSAKTPHKYIGPPSGPEDHDWFCAGFDPSYIVGAVNEK